MEAPSQQSGHCSGKRDSDEAIVIGENGRERNLCTGVAGLHLYGIDVFLSAYLIENFAAFGEIIYLVKIAFLQRDSGADRKVSGGIVVSGVQRVVDTLYGTDS